MTDKRYGHPRFYELTKEMNRKHSAKNKDYAKGGNPLGNFYRVSAIKQLYPGLRWDTPLGTSLGFMLKQFDAAFWMICQDMKGETEGIPERFMDVGVYSQIATVLYEEEHKKDDLSVGG